MCLDFCSLHIIIRVGILAILSDVLIIVLHKIDALYKTLSFRPELGIYT